MNDNTPPTVYLNRNWVLRESDPVGYVVERVRAEDNEQDELTYGLEPSSLNYNRDAAPQPPLPFAINNATGIIYLNETLKGRVRKSALLALFLDFCLTELSPREPVSAVLAVSAISNFLSVAPRETMIGLLC